MAFLLNKEKNKYIELNLFTVTDLMSCPRSAHMNCHRIA